MYFSDTLTCLQWKRIMSLNHEESNETFKLNRILYTRTLSERCGSFNLDKKTGLCRDRQNYLCRG